MIPRLIHFTWKTQELPRQMAAYYAQWQRLHPGWEVRLWTDASMRDFVVESYPEFLAVYDGYPRMIQRADAFRYLVLGKLGGIYADLDVEPLQSCEPLLGLGCFVGVEPLEHIGPDRRHQGMPVLFSNAFMGSVPGHPFWRAICRTMPDLLDQEVFYSTGPSMVTAVGLKLPRAQRPVLLLPEVWSPLLSNGRKGHSDAALKRSLSGVAELVEATGGTLVSHKWHTTWVPFHKRQTRYGELFQLPTRLKWWVRRQRYPELAAAHIPDSLGTYFDQHLTPVEDRPRVQIVVRADADGLSKALASSLEGLSYPVDRRSTTVIAGPVGSAAALNLCLDATAQDVEFVLLVDGRVRGIPPDAIEQMLAARRPVVAANCVDAAGADADPALFRYKDGGSFKVLYKDGGRSGRVQGSSNFRKSLSEQKVFSILPLDGVGESFVLVRRDVIEAGVRFAETPYKLHLGGEAFGIMARDKGFEVAGLPGLRVIKAG